jgi:hypothetical protein
VASIEDAEQADRSNQNSVAAGDVATVGGEDAEIDLDGSAGRIQHALHQHFTAIRPNREQLTMTARKVGRRGRDDTES